MTGIYWRSSHARPLGLTFAMGVALLALGVTELSLTTRQQPYTAEKIEAARLCERAFDVLRDERQRRQLPINAEVDPALSGLIGALLTPITTDAGKLAAKQTSINPNFAAVVVELLKSAGVRRGDAVAISMTGSFPGFNVAVLSAVAALGLRPLLLVSAAASQWGANEPAFSWLDMLGTLKSRSVFSVQPLAASRGGVADVARGMSESGQTLLDSAIERLGVQRLTPRTWDEGVQERMSLLKQAAGSDRIAAYINVGGGYFSLGSVAGRHSFAPGLNTEQPEGMPMVNSVMQRFLNDEVPVINMLQAETLARKFGLPIAPSIRPVVGDGGVFNRPAYNRYVATIGILVIVLTMLATVRQRGSI